MARLRAIPALSGVICLVAAGAAQATTYNVTRADDPSAVACLTPAGGCSLRQALTAINAAPGSADQINLPAGTYANTQAAEFPVGQSVSIVGAGSRSTIVRGSATSRVFNVSGAGAVVSLSDMTISGGRTGEAGGGVAVNVPTAQLTLRGVALVDNWGGVGGGISYIGTAPLTVVDSLVANNQATSSLGAGGGIWLASPALLTNVTVTGNATTGATGPGGGIFKSVGSAGVVRVASSTIAGNSAQPGVGNGGNLSGPFTVRNSIIAGGLPTENCGTKALVSEGHNLEDRDQCFASRATTDRVNTAPALGPLAGQPDASSTLALLPGSPAINTGDSAGCPDAAGALVTRDQRGVGRPQGARCDVGAFEFALPLLAGVPTLTGTPRPGGTLTCVAPGVSSPDGPAPPVFAWLRDGASVAAGATYPVSAADQGRALACALVATNAAGSARAQSAAVTVLAALAPPPAARAPRLTLASRTVTVDRKTGRATLRATCSARPGRSCVLRGTLYGAGTLPAGASAAAKRLGTVRGTVAAGRRGTLVLRLTAAARRQLARTPRRRVRLAGTVRDGAGQSTRLRTTLTLKPKKKGR